MSTHCSVCLKFVRSNQRAILCDNCSKWTHAKCAHLSNDEYVMLGSSAEPWFCTCCLQSIFPFNHIVNENEFVMAITDSVDYLSLTFNPFLYDEKRFLLNMEDMDPDLNYYNNIAFTDTVYKLPSELQHTEEENNCFNFSLLHANCRGFQHNFDKLTSFLNLISFDVSVVATSETWTDSDNHDDYQLPDYNFEVISRSHKSCGGVGLFIHESLQYKLRNDLCINVPDVLESIFIELELNKVIVGCLYHPPGTDLASFTAYFDTLLSKINTEKKACYIAGDFNVNLLKHDTHTPTSDYINCVFSHYFYPTINKPTRISDISATLIDNILTNSTQAKYIPSIVYADISDHLPILIQTDLALKKQTLPKFVYRRSFTERAKATFTQMLQSINWSDLSTDNMDPNVAFKVFSKTFLDVYEACFPIRKVNITRKRNPRKPWMTTGLIKSCIKKEKLYKLRIKHPTDQNIINYKNYRNKLNKIIRAAQKNYYAQQFETFKSNIKLTWQTIKCILHKNNNTPLVTSFKINNAETTDKSVIVNKFNEYFVNIGPSLANKFSDSTDNFMTYLRGNYKDSFSLFPTSPEEIINVVQAMASKKSSGYDNVSVDIMKLAILYVAKPMSKIINNSFFSGVVPDDIKIAKVCPIYKNGDKAEVSNYRPISVLSSFSKIFEKVVCNRLTNYLTKYSILHNGQYGFRSNHDTTLAVIDMVDKITTAIDSSQYSIGIFIDLSKAFDTINHKILLAKLSHYGIRGVALEWFKSYLTNRYQYVEFNGATSSLLKITCGVPQGSILGPVLFLLYINDIVNATDVLQLILFADDTNIFLSDTNLDRLILTANYELAFIVKWFDSNKLSLNLTKTNFIIFCSARKKYLKPQVKIKLNGIAVEQVQSAKFLGVHIDEHLKWDKHIQQVASKLSKNIGILAKLKYFLPYTVLLMLYNTLVLPYLSYCNLIWACTSTNTLNPLIVLQKRAVRTIARTGSRAHTSPLFKNLYLLKLKDICYFQTILFMFKFLQSRLPPKFNNYFTFVSSVHSYSTRSSSAAFTIPFCHTSIRQTCIRYQGPLAWNKLPSDIKLSHSVSKFKDILKLYIIAQY